MIEIKDLLIKFDKLIYKEELKVFLIREAIKEITGIEIDKEKIKFKNNTLYLDIKPIYKNEIFINKEKIVAHLEQNKGIKNLDKVF